MQQRLVLDATGYQVVFDNLVVSTDDYWYPHVSFYIALKPDLPIVEVARLAIATRDFIDLAKYLRHHLAQLFINDDFESPIFMSSEFSFQVQAFSGYVEENESGAFSFQFLLNIGNNKKINPMNWQDTYIGGWTSVDVNKTKQFILDIETLLHP